MRCVYGALVLTSLMWPKDRSGGLAPRSPREGPRLGPCRGEGKRAQLQNTFSLYPGLCWVWESPWGANLAGMALLLLCVLVETWASSRLARWRAKLQETEASWTDPQPETQREEDPQSPQRRGSPYICEKCLASGLESYQPPGQRRHRPPPLTFHIAGARPQKDGRPGYYRSRSPSTSPSSSSSSSSSSSCCLVRLKHLDLPPSSGKFPTVEDSSWMAYDSSDESQASDRCSGPEDAEDEEDNLRVLEMKRKISYSSLQPERVLPRRREMPGPFPEEGGETPQPILPRIREMPGRFPEEEEEEEKPEPGPSFAQINFTQSSAYKKEGGLVLVERCFEIHIGEMPPDVDRLDPLAALFAGQEATREAPRALGLLDQMALKLPRAPVPKTPPQTGHPPGPDMFIRTTSALGGLDPDAFVLDKMDDQILSFLEFHVKKKMVQSQCGAPTVVVRSVQRFQSLEDLCHMALKSERLTPAKRAPLRSRSPAGFGFRARNAVVIGAKPWQELPGAKEYYILRPVKPEEVKTLAFGPGAKKPGIKMALLQEVREKYVLLSMRPDELRRIVFHITAKMLEVKRGTFPEVVERSFRTFGSLSARPLPKTIRWGNKVTRPKQVVLPFVPGEALCLIDLNIKHKYMVYVWKLPTPYSRSEEEMTTTASQPSGTKGHQPLDPSVPIVALKVPEADARPQATEPQKWPGFSSPQLTIAGTPPERCPEKSLVRFIDIFPGRMSAREVCPESAIMPRKAAVVGALETIEPAEPGLTIAGTPPEGLVHFIDISLGKMLARDVCPESAIMPREAAVAGAPEKPAVKRVAISKALQLTLSKEGGMTSGEGMAAEEGEEEGSQEPKAVDSAKEVLGPPIEAGAEPCGEGAPGEADLPSPSGEEAEEAERRGGPVVVVVKELLWPPSVDATDQEDGERTGAEDAQEPPKEMEGSSSLPSSKKKGPEGHGARIRGARGPPKPPQRPASCKAALSLDRRGTKAQEEAAADGTKPRMEEAGKRPKEASIVRASLFLELELAKEKLNLHLKKKLDARLRPKQGAHLNLDVELDKAAGDRRARKAKKAPHRAHRHRQQDRDRDQDQDQAKPGRPFCYVCMSLDKAGSEVKTVCWTLPRRILEMNGHRVPQVARFE